MQDRRGMVGREGKPHAQIPFGISRIESTCVRLRGGWGVWRGCYIGKVECFQVKVGGRRGARKELNALY